MKKRILGVLTLAIVVVFSACNSLKVVTDFDTSTDFTKFKTFEFYGWDERTDDYLSPFDKKRIEEAVETEMVERGMEYKETGADLIITLYVHTEVETEVQATTTNTYGYGGYYGYGPRYGWGPGYGYSTTTYDEYDYLMGTLVIDIYDAAEEKLIYESAGTKQLHPDNTPEQREKVIVQVADQMMYKYPVKPKK